MKQTKLFEFFLATLILLFLYTAVAKLGSISVFEASLKRQPLPGWSRPYLLWIIPLSEIAVSICLFYERLSSWFLPKSSRISQPAAIRKMQTIGLIGSTILMTLFTGYVTLAVLKVFKKVPCSCGGVIGKLSWPQHLAFNIIFLAISATALVLIMKGKDCKNESMSGKISPVLHT